MISVSSQPFLKKLKKIAATFAGPATVFWTLPWLLVILILGTWAQRDMGLFEAQQLYLSSFFIWFGPLPLPGMAITISVLFLSMVIKFVFFSPFAMKRAGIIVSHLGVLVLLMGGIITFFSQQEWLLIIREGDESSALLDYNQRVLKIYQDDALVVQIPYETLTLDQPLSWSQDPNMSFSLTPKFLCRNCKSKPLPPEGEDQPPRFGILQKIGLDHNETSKDSSTNIAGIEILVEGLDEDQDGLYATLEEVPVRPVLDTDSGLVELQMSKLETPLPFSIYLEDFKKEDYPGTQMAKAYSSQIIVRDGDVEWPVLIKMNDPLRYKGYTFYQSSFIEGPDGERTVLSVVRNSGRLFPYIASFIIFCGLLLHSLILLREHLEKRA